MTELEITNKKALLTNTAVGLLKELISIPSLSKSEDKAADHVEVFFTEQNIKTNRVKNNIWVGNKFFTPGKYTILLNSHHDTVKPNAGYTFDPFEAKEIDGKIYGLGSNDAGGCLVSLLSTFLFFYDQENLSYNLVFAASAEEEISGKNGIEFLLPQLPKIDCAIVGEPTSLQMAVAEKGLLVLDCTSSGKAGHAAREEGENSIYKAMQEIEWFKHFRFPLQSDLLGPIHMSVTSIHTNNTLHNVVPDSCSFVVDIRVNEFYSFEEILTEIEKNISSVCIPRSLRLKPGSIAFTHPLVQAGEKLGLQKYGSPTLSDGALLPFPVLKIGPGDSERSHTANEFIYVQQIKDGIETYIQILQNLANDPSINIKSSK